MTEIPQLTQEESFDGFHPHVMPDVSAFSAKQKPLLATLFSMNSKVREGTLKEYNKIEDEIQAVYDAHFAKCQRYFKHMGWIK